MRIPSTQALRALDSFARHGSVWRAADELHLTRSAVSHQLRLLERDLGFDLLERIGKGVALTPRGQRYAQRRAQGAHRARRCGDAHMPARGVGGSFSVCCTPGFASLLAVHPYRRVPGDVSDVSLRILTPRRLDDVSNPDADAFIAFGVGNWPNRSGRTAVRGRVHAALQPDAAQQDRRPFQAGRRAARQPLHLGDTEDWARWLALSARWRTPIPEGGIIFSDMNLVFSAAIAGQGIAMGDELTSRRALSEGRLVRPFDIAIKSPRSYFLVSEHAKARIRSLRPSAAGCGG